MPSTTATNGLNRREFLRLTTFTLGTSLLAACVPAAETPGPATGPTSLPPTAQPAAPTQAPEPAGPTSRFQEAPMLADKVAAGELPPVDERLPVTPAVVKGVDGVGNYGGTWRRGFTGTSDRPGITIHMEQGHGTVRLDPDLNIVPSLAESWEVNEDGSSWTWHLREGIKWSDGYPFTSEAFTWQWEHRYKNETLTKSPPGLLSSGDPRTLAELTAPDAYTVTMTFQEPMPLLGLRIAGRNPRPFALFTPSQYMQQFHPDFADPDELAALAKEKGFETWDQLYLDMHEWHLHPEFPTVFAFQAMTPLNSEIMLFERNPYYYQIDEAGNQLPYLDTVQFRMFSSPDVYNLWILNGEIDLQARHVDVGNYTLFKEGEAAGDYVLESMASALHTCFTPNHSTQDERLAGLFQDRRFRIAMSHAVNRDEVNELVYNGLATPRQYSPIEGSPQFYPKLSNAYLEYDPDAANALLDEIGLTERDGEGFRLWNDDSGEVVSFTIEGVDSPGSPGEDHALMAIAYMAEVGIKATYKFVERSLYAEHCSANLIEAAWIPWHNRTVLPLIAPGIFLGTHQDFPWALGWAQWKADPSLPNAVEPPEGHWIRTLWDLAADLAQAPDQEAQNAIFFQMLDIWAEELPQVGYLGMFPQLTIVKNGFKNFRGGYPFDDPTGYESVLQNQTFFWDDPSQHA